MKKYICLSLLIIAALVFGAEQDSCVYVGHTNLFCLQNSDGDLGPVQRASIATYAIESIMTSPDGALDSIKLVKTDSAYSIIFRGKCDGDKQDIIRIIDVLSMDTLGSGMTVDKLANKWYWDIRKGISEERQRSWGFDNLAKLALGILFPFLVLFLYILIDKAYRALAKSVVRREGRTFRGIKFRKVAIIPPQLQVSITLKLLLVIKWVVIALALYAMIFVFFTLFPATQQYSQAILEVSIDWLKKIGHILASVLKFAVVGLVLYVIARIFWAITDMVFRHYEEAPESTSIPNPAIIPLKRLVKALIVLIFVVALIAVIPGPGEYLAFGMFILIGVFVGIAALPFISSVFAGLALLLARRVCEGDRVRLGRIAGKVSNVGIVWTKIKTDSGEEVALFNSMIIREPMLIEKADKRESSVRREPEGESES